MPGRKIDVGEEDKLLPYIRMADVCRLFGYSPSRDGQAWMCKRIGERIRTAKGKLDRWDPRVRVKGKYQHKYYVTMTTLRMLFPEKFDKPNEMIRHLERRLREFDERFAEQRAQIEAERGESQRRDKILKKAIEDLAAIVVEVRSKKSNAA